MVYILGHSTKQRELFHWSLGSIQVEEILVAAACFLHHINLTTVSVYHLLTYCYDCNVVMRMEGVESVDLTGDASCAWIIFRHLLVTCWSLYCLAPSSICACMVGRIVDVVHNQSLYVEHHGSLTRKPQWDWQILFWSPQSIMQLHMLKSVPLQLCCTH